MTSTANIDIGIASLTSFLVKLFYGLFFDFRSSSAIWAKSQGPVTPEGKAKSALNAVTHGLSPSAVVLTTESKEKYEAMFASYCERCDPDGPIENALVDQLAAADWQQRRVTSMITVLLAFANQADQSGALALLNRYAARHARDLHRALSDLRKVQADRHSSAGARVSDDPPATEQNAKRTRRPASHRPASRN
jgi:hypothetical protein